MQFPDIIDIITKPVIPDVECPGAGLSDVVEVSIDTHGAKFDNSSWYAVYFKDNFNTTNAVLVKDIDGTDIIGDVSGLTDGIISFTFDYINDTVGGDAGTDKECVVLVEGNGVVKQHLTNFTIRQTNLLSVSCDPGTEYNP